MSFLSHPLKVDDIGGYTVSTVYAGPVAMKYVNEKYQTGDLPLLWETAVFGPDHSLATRLYARYASEDAALSGHAFACGQVRRAI
jgi:hypothetical protein